MLNKFRRAAEKAIAPAAVLSYSQSGEDLVLDFLTNYAPDGFYVDVGCNHPLKASNTYRFYRKGWRGICVDANKAFRNAWAAKRPRDIFVNACISDRVEQLTFHHFAADGLSSVSGEKFYDNAQHYELKDVEQVEARPLQEILFETDCPKNFEFLSIDIEGHDEKALVGLDLSWFKPGIIVVEQHSADIARIGDHPIAQRVARFGYVPIAAHWTNLFFRLER